MKLFGLFFAFVAAGPVPSSDGIPECGLQCFKNIILDLNNCDPLEGQDKLTCVRKARRDYIKCFENC